MISDLFSYELVPPARLLLGSGVIVLCIYAIYRQVEVRLALLGTALVLGLLAGRPDGVIRKFLETFANEKFVVPICTAMGFAYVLRHTQCDQHLVHLLIKPLTRVRFLLVPGTVLVGFLVNMPIVSQTSTAVTLAPVVVPILRAARIAPVTIGAAILLGCSIGGELLNPGAPELRTIIQETQRAAPDFGHEPAQFDSQRCLRRILPLDLVGLAVATAIFWYLARGDSASEQSVQPLADDFRVHPGKALVPLVPLLLLYLTGPPLQLIGVDYTWLTQPIGGAATGTQDSWLIGFAMLLGAVVAGLALGRDAGRTTRAFFEGAGFGFTHIISLIVAANCFGEGVKLVGLAEELGELIRAMPDLLIPTAGVLPWSFGILCGSGMASTQSLFGFFVRPAFELGVDPVHVGAVVSLAAAAGRTMSPVAAVVLMTATLTGIPALDLVRRLAVPLMGGLLAVIIVAAMTAPPP